MKIDIKMMNFDAAKNTVTGIVDVDSPTITVNKFELSSGASPHKLYKHYLSELYVTTKH